MATVTRWSQTGDQDQAQGNSVSTHCYNILNLLFAGWLNQLPVTLCYNTDLRYNFSELLLE